MRLEQLTARKIMAEDGELRLECALFEARGVWFYQVPPGQVSSLSPRADSWDPEHPLLTGALLVLQVGDACVIRLFEPAGESAAAAGEAPPQRTLFAQCPLDISRELPLDVYVQDCVDSSRYFMLRVEDEATQRRAYVGVGFPDRAVAFNFKAALQDYAKYALRQAEAEAAAAASAADGVTDGGQASPLGRTQDLSLPQGATIRINLKGVTDAGSAEKSLRRRTSSGEASPGKVPLLPPPPSGPVVGRAAQPVAAAADDDEWGDFTSA